MKKAKEWSIPCNDVQTSFDMVNLYPSVPIDEAAAVITDILDKGIDDLHKRTKFYLETKTSFKKHVFWSKKFVLSNTNKLEQFADGAVVVEFT